MACGREESTANKTDTSECTKQGVRVAVCCRGEVVMSTFLESLWTVPRFFHVNTGKYHRAGRLSQLVGLQGIIITEALSLAELGWLFVEELA